MPVRGLRSRSKSNLVSTAKTLNRTQGWIVAVDGSALIWTGFHSSNEITALAADYCAAWSGKNLQRRYLFGEAAFDKITFLRRQI